MSNSSLLEITSSLPIAINFQLSFVKRESTGGDNSLLQRMCWVIKVANWLKVPLVVAEEDIPHNESISDDVAKFK